MNKNDRNVLEPIAVQRITSHNEVRHPLHMASMNGHLGSVQLLIQLGADVNCRDGQGRTAAHLAIMRGHQHILELLLCHDLDPAAVDKDGNTLLSLAASIGLNPVIVLLLEWGAQLECNSARYT